MTKAAAPDRTPGSLRTVIDGAHRRLSAAGVPSPRHDAEALAAFVIGCPPARLLVAGDLSAGQHVVFTELVARRESRIPLQHLTGSAAFRYLELAVGPGVFVPRPETEVVAGWCIDALRMRAIDPADLAPGRQLRPGAGRRPVHGVRRDCPVDRPGGQRHCRSCGRTRMCCLTWARRNVTGSRVILHQADASGALTELDGLVDLVVSNPPYLPRPSAPTSSRRCATTIRRPRCGVASTDWPAPA